MKSKQVEVVEVSLPEYCWQEVWELIALFMSYLGICALIFVGIAAFFG